MKIELRSRTRHMLWLIVVVMVMTVAGATTATEEEDLKWGFQPKMSLAVIVPWRNDVALQDDGGFSLTLQMSAWEYKILGIGKAAYPPVLPGDKSPGFLVFDDPDGCPSFISKPWQVGAYEDVFCLGTPPGGWPDCQPEDWRSLLTYDCPADAPDRPTWLAQFEAIEGWDFDETWVEFFSGIYTPSNMLPEEWGRRPEVWAHGVECDPYPDPVPPDYVPNCWPTLAPFGVGPNVGFDDDFIRWGRWDRLPGLVVIADHGPALITQPVDPNIPPYEVTNPPAPTPHGFFDTQYPLRAWNMAGQFQALGHTLLANRDAWPGWGQTTLTATLLARNNLFKPVGLIDREISIPFIDDFDILCDVGHSAYQIDGGPLTCVPYRLNFLDEFASETLVTVRIFVVNGDAPDVVWDMNGDDVIDLEDLEAMGHEAVTRERTIRFNQISEGYCGVPYDFDGDNKSGICVFGARAGGITGVPR